jgi:GntR family transcriptional regulator / MocR family aminotransferase
MNTNYVPIQLIGLSIIWYNWPYLHHGKLGNISLEKGASMRIPIDRNSEIPIYQQIEAFLRQNIVSGQLESNTRLPATRQLAHHLGINRITVESAYAALEADGLIQSRRGSGTYVLPPPTLPEIPERKPGAPWPLWQQELQSEAPSSPGSRPGGTAARCRSSGPDQFCERIRRCSPVSGGRLPQGYPKCFKTRWNGSPGLWRSAWLCTSAQYRGAYPGFSGHPARQENVLITAGSQQAIALVSQLLLKPGDTLLVESPTYAVALDSIPFAGL